MASDTLTVLITNLTDLSNSPIPIDIYSKTVPPGKTLKVPAVLINSKLRVMERKGLISIGQIPTWYESAKKPDNVMSKEDIVARVSASLVKKEPEDAEEPPKAIGFKELKKEPKKNKEE